MGSPSFIEKRARKTRRHSPPARTSLFIANVRAALRPAFRSISPHRAGLSGIRTQRLAGSEKIRLHLRSHCRNHESLHRSDSDSRATHFTCRIMAARLVFAWRWSIRNALKRSLSRTPLRTMKVWARIGKRGASFGTIAQPTKRASHKSSLAADNANAPCGERSQRRAL